MPTIPLWVLKTPYVYTIHMNSQRLYLADDTSPKSGDRGPESPAYGDEEHDEDQFRPPDGHSALHQTGSGGRTRSCGSFR